MRKTTLTIGLLLILAGAFIINQGAQSLIPIANLAGLASHTRAESAIITSTLVSIPPSNYTYFSADLREGVPVVGTVQIEDAREIGFYVMDEGNFSEWSAGHPANILLAKPLAISYNFTFIPSVSGTYFFVFDNQDRDGRVIVFNLNSVQDVSVLNPLVQYLSYELLLIGILMVTFGIKTGGRRSQESVAAKCRFCGAKIETGQTFCTKCNRSQI